MSVEDKDGVRWIEEIRMKEEFFEESEKERREGRREGRRGEERDEEKRILNE